ncbi:unnamed protein product [Brassica napus]|uniref:(rape) hypothetical protein n=1 Tax=Brassica napus TaxID=3708 RepID=A0A816K8K0_BRANA|nr:unnamed protein product [Brassica napus]
MAELNNFIVTAPTQGEFLALTQIGDGVMLLTLNAVGNCSAPSLLLHVFDALILMPLRLFDGYC